MLAAREQASGRQADFPQLFAAFQQPGKLGPMLALCLPGVAAGLLVMILAVIFLGSALLAAGVSSAADANALAGLSLGAGGLVFAALAVLILLAAYALVFFAIPRVMLDQHQPVAAMQESLRACLANWAALLVFIAVMVLAMLLASLLLGWIPLLGPLAITVVLVPVVSTAIYIASREVFGDSSAGDADDVPPAPPSVEV
jgi:hypothetical protein